MLFNSQDHIHMAKGDELKSGTKFNCDLTESGTIFTDTFYMGIV